MACDSWRRYSPDVSPWHLLLFGPPSALMQRDSWMSLLVPWCPLCRSCGDDFVHSAGARVYGQGIFYFGMAEPSHPHCGITAL